MTWLKQIRPFPASWKSITWAGLIAGGFLAAIVIFLKPYGSENYTMSFAFLRQAGYTLAILAALLLLHPVELYVYRRQGRRWYLWNEILYLPVVAGFCTMASVVYNFYVINAYSGFTWDYVYQFVVYFVPPYLPIMLPTLWFVRAYHGRIVIEDVAQKQAVPLRISGESKTDFVECLDSDVIMAQAQQNYVAIFVRTEEGYRKELVRSSLSRIAAQLPDAVQVHRSYLVNLDYLETVQGNARKREMTFNLDLDPIPVSQKYYDALKRYLSDSSR